MTEKAQIFFARAFGARVITHIISAGCARKNSAKGIKSAKFIFWCVLSALDSAPKFMMKVLARNSI